MMNKNQKKCFILIPTFNDWVSLEILLKKIEDNIKDEQRVYEILIIDDASTIDHDLKISEIKKIKKIDIIRLKKNSGSQLAIAAGLNFINKEKENGDILILDSDGEDDPNKLLTLINYLKQDVTKVVVAERKKRKENVLLKFLNIIRLYFTFIFTGKMMNYGNFSCLTNKHLEQIYDKKELNLSYSGTIQKFLPIKKIPIEKQVRYSGKSKVSIIFLILYSIQILSIFSANFFIRTTMFLTFLIVFHYFSDLNLYIELAVILYLISNLLILKTFSSARNIDFLKLIEKIDKVK
tara:strand:+ start:299 stop:1177 length:879 start_codon:yes stop_codon:yes gene_type:complete